MRIPKHFHTVDEIIGTSLAEVQPTRSFKDTRAATFIVRPDGKGDYRNIQDAVNALPANGGLIFIHGAHEISSPISISKPNTGLIGLDRESTKIVMSTNQPLVSVNDVDRVRVENLSLIGPGASNTSTDALKLDNVTSFVGRNLSIQKCYNAIRLLTSSWFNLFENIYIGGGAGLGCGRVLKAESAGGDNFTMYHVWASDFYDIGLADWAAIEIEKQNAPRLIACDIISPPKDGIWIKKSAPGMMLNTNTAIDNAGRYAVRIEDPAAVEDVMQIEFIDCWLKTIGSYETIRLKKTKRILFQGGVILGGTKCFYILNSYDIMINRPLMLANVVGTTQASADGVIIDASHYVSVEGQIAADNPINRGVAEINGASNNVIKCLFSGTITTRVARLSGNSTIAIFPDGTGAIQIDPGLINTDSIWTKAIKPQGGNLTGSIGVSGEKWLESYIQSMWCRDVKPYTPNTGTIGDATYPFWEAVIKWIKANEMFECLSAGNGLIVVTPDGTKRYKIRVDNAGNVVTDLVP